LLAFPPREIRTHFKKNESNRGSVAGSDRIRKQVSLITASQVSSGVSILRN
jgi:hypothetical protein